MRYQLGKGTWGGACQYIGADCHDLVISGIAWDHALIVPTLGV